MLNCKQNCITCPIPIVTWKGYAGKYSLLQPDSSDDDSYVNDNDDDDEDGDDDSYGGDWKPVSIEFASVSTIFS